MPHIFSSNWIQTAKTYSVQQENTCTTEYQLGSIGLKQAIIWFKNRLRCFNLMQVCEYAGIYVIRKGVCVCVYDTHTNSHL